MDKVYIVYADHGYGSIDLKRVFLRKEDAELFTQGADAAYASLTMKEWDVYDHSTATQPKGGEGEGE